MLPIREGRLENSFGEVVSKSEKAPRGVLRANRSFREREKRIKKRGHFERLSQREVVSREVGENDTLLIQSSFHFMPFQFMTYIQPNPPKAD